MSTHKTHNMTTRSDKSLEIQGNTPTNGSPSGDTGDDDEFDKTIVEFKNGNPTTKSPNDDHHNSNKKKSPPSVLSNTQKKDLLSAGQNNYTSQQKSNKPKSLHSKTTSSRISIKSDVKKCELELHYMTQQYEIENQRLQLEFKKTQLELERKLELLKIEEQDVNSDSCDTNSETTDGSNITKKSKFVEEWVHKPNQKKSQLKEVGEIFDFNDIDDSAKVNDMDMKNFIARQTITQSLPQFSGDPLEWPIFISEFENSTKLCNFNDYENVSRLRRALTGKAKESVQSLLLLPQNVNKIIETLKDRFGNPSHIVRHLIEKVRNISVPREDKVQHFLKFYDIVSDLIHSLESLDQQDHIRSPWLCDEILLKLPATQRIAFVQYYNDHSITEPRIFALHKWLSKKAKAISQMPTAPSDEDKDKDRNKHKGAKPKNDVTLTTTTDKQTVSKTYCHFCESDSHRVTECDSYKKLDVDNRWKLVSEKSLCISCLGRNHSLKNCKRRKNCGVDECKRPHHKLLHKKDTMIHKTEKKESKTENDNDTVTDKNCHINETKNHIFLKVVPIIVEGEKSTISTYALLDDASTVTIIDENLANDLELDGPVRPLRLQWTNEQINEQDDSKTVSLKIRGDFENSKSFTLRRVKTLSGLSLPTQSVDINDFPNLHPYFKSYSNMSFKNAKPQLLIGQDNWPLIVSRKLKYGSWDGPVASKTLLGWVIHGNLNESTVSTNDYLCHVYDKPTNLTDGDELNVIHDLIKQQWKLENDLTTSDIEISRDDRRCMTIIDKTLKRVENKDKFECGLFWKEDDLQLPESYSTAYSRLKHLESKMDRNVEYGKRYCDKMNEYVEKGYLKKLSKDEARQTNQLTWYLPHFGIVNPNKPNKLRIVFDAAAKSNGNSLNDFLLTGPDLYNSLPTILLNFGIHKIAFAGDIKEMFLQVDVIPADRQAQRLLWRDMNRVDPPQIYEIQVVFFGAKCSPCIAQEVKNRNALEFADQFPDASNEIVKKHYMDDYLGGANTVEDAVKLIDDVINIHKKAGFQICGWISNSKEVLSQIEPNLKLTDEKEIDDGMKEERILGLWWNYHTDEFSFRLKFHKLKNPEILTMTKRPTKRDILVVLMSIFDPLGYLANFLIGGKILLQCIWESAIGWDDTLTDEQFVLWEDWCKKLHLISTYSIPRQLTHFPLTECSVQLHIFCDASKYAYASCAYLRFEYNGNIDCKLLIAKSRVAPLKPTSIPRLELQGCLQGARLCNYVKNSLDVKIDKTYLWTDSEVVLCWIRSSSKRFKVFVAQRLGEIQELTDTSWWRHVPSKINIADDATKVKPINFSQTSPWVKGPQFLYLNENEWPQKNPFNKNVLESEETVTEYVHMTNENTRDIVLPDVRRFSIWNRFLRTTAWMLRFVKMIQNNTRRSDNAELQPCEINDAQKLICRKIQLDSYPNEIRCLLNKKPFQQSSTVKTLPLIIDTDGLIRLTGRMDNVDDKDLSYSSKNPILLNGRHAMTQLIIDHYHKENCHIGHDTIISNLRQTFWITNCRNAVKKVSYNCQYCRNEKAKPQIPKMAQLPNCRVNPTERPFIKTGVDYFGPIEVTVNRKHEKRYGVIFTCMVTRAVNLEIAYDLSCNSFLHVFTQFGTRRGFPEEVYSDNGTNFRKAEKEIRTAQDNWKTDEEITPFMTMKKVQWCFNPPSAPHMGGAWERLIQSIKKHLHFLLKERYPKEYVLRTLFCEVENMMNSRPLTDISIDCEDAVPLTPNDFLIGPSSSSLPIVQTSDRDLNLLNMWKASQRLTDLLWQHWKKVYRQHILISRKWSKDCQNLKQGDVVLVVDPNGPRNVWPKGIIIETFPSRDGRTRIVDVKTTSGVFRRPVTRCIKLDVNK